LWHILGLNKRSHFINNIKTLGGGRMSKVQNQLKNIAKSLESLAGKLEKLTNQLDKESPKAAAAPKKAAAKPKKAAAAPAKSKKKAPAAKPAPVAEESGTVLENVMDVITKSRSGANIADLKAKTGLESRQLSNALYKLSKKGQIKTISRGVYVKA
jgi:predicted Rossmann fold nucleotide-binding protein DprA/Smf involved in DNA uptake